MSNKKFIRHKTTDNDDQPNRLVVDLDKFKMRFDNSYILVSSRDGDKLVYAIPHRLVCYVGEEY